MNSSCCQFCDRPITDLWSTQCLFLGSGLPWYHAVWLGTCRTTSTFLCYGHGCTREPRSQCFWILSSNSWMQTCKALALKMASSCHKIGLRSFSIRHFHIVYLAAAAAFLVSALLVASTAGWHLLKGRRDALVKKSFSMAMWMVLILAPLQVVIGDNHGLNTLKQINCQIGCHRRALKSK